MDSKSSKYLEQEKIEQQYHAYGSARSAQPVSLSHLQARFLADIAVPVHVEIGELMLSAEEVIDLAEDQVIDFELNPAEAVSLRVGSETVARGRLAVCDGRLVIQVMSIVSDLSSKPPETLVDSVTTKHREEKGYLHQDYLNTANQEKENSHG
jgi:flagellar motor switch/type III secretory pathway protein FliN